MRIGIVALLFFFTVSHAFTSPMSLKSSVLTLALFLKSFLHDLVSSLRIAPREEVTPAAQ